MEKDACPQQAQLRSLTEEDAPAVARIAALLGVAESPAFWRRKLESFSGDSAFCVGVEVDGQLVAYLLAHVKGGEFGLSEDAAWIEMLGVHPAFQGQGLARTLAEALFERLVAKDVRRVLTLVSPQNDAIRPFFRSLGLRQSPLICLERDL